MNHGLYLAYELGTAALAPWRQAWLASLHHVTCVSGTLPVAVRDACATWELVAGLQVSGRRPPFGPMTDDTEEEVVAELPFCSLLRFRRLAGAPRVLLVAPLSGHFASRLRDTVRALLDRHEVYVTDWHNARDVPLQDGDFDLDDYIDYLLRFVRQVGPRVHLVAICQACTPALAATSLLAEDEDPNRPLSLTLMCGPVDPRINPTAIDVYAASAPASWFERCMTTAVPPGFAGAGRRVAPGFLQVPSLSWTESSGRLSGLLQSCAGLGNWEHSQVERARQCYRDEFSLLDLSAGFYLSTINRVFREAAMPRHRFHWRGRPVRPEAILDCSLMTIEAAEDDVCGAGQTHAAHDLCAGLPPGLRTRMTQERTGHVALFDGPAWRNAVYPALRAMIAHREAVSTYPVVPAKRLPAASVIRWRMPRRRRRMTGLDASVPVAVCSWMRAARGRRT